MATLIQIRRDTQANWTANDPILASGEIAFSTDQYKIKIGDGTSNWSSLAYMTATPTEITNQINAAISNIIDSAPGTLDTLNELAAALNDDPDFFNTVATNLSNHESDTTNVHGIADTSLLATTSYVDTAESDAITSANSYSDSLAVNYDPAGSASAAQTAAESYADSLAINYDAAGSASAVASDLTDHENATTNVHGISDTSALATTSYVDTAEADAVTSANSYSDSLAVNYDPAGSAATAESNANSYADSLATNYDPAGSASAAQTAAEAYADSTFVPLTDIGSANGVASLDGNAKIPSTQLPAIAIVNTSVVNSEAAMLALTAEQGDVAVRTDINKSFILSGTDSTLLSDWQELLSPTDAVQSVDGRTGTVSLSDLYDAAGSSTTAESNANSYTDSAISTHNLDTTSVHGISDTSNLVYTDDSRLSDARTPTSHASTHTSGGSDEITIAQSQVTDLSTDLSAKAPLSSPTFTGTVDFTSATVTGIDLLPDQTGNSGKYLTTDGSNASWGTINVEPTIHPMFIIGGV